MGGEITEYTKLQAQSREQAIQRIIDDAKTLNADTISISDLPHQWLCKASRFWPTEQLLN